MSKKQLILASMITAIPAWGLVAFILWNAFSHFGNWGIMHFVVSVVAALCAVFLGVLPFLLAMFYREDPAFAAAGTAATAPVPAREESPPDDDGVENDELDGEIDDALDDDDFEDDEFGDDDFDEFEDDFEEK